ncbi:DUF1796 family putative cysteine peptidase [Terribacillus saccharophilus]|uniref:DUF1796 family putative cysteine peptidase n=1 Tax=Terribacillus saccharophilus TaxID=361277 RepID=UPI0037FD7EC0
MLEENLQIVVKAIDKMLLISDDRNLVMSNHDFEIANNSMTQLLMYPMVKEKLNRRVNRLFKKLVTAQRILFIRTNASLEETAVL